MMYRSAFRTTKPRRPFSTRWYEDRLDTTVSLIVRFLTPYCVICLSVVNLENGHLFTRTWRPTRWDIEAGGNCATLCRKCNQRHEAEPSHFISWYISNFGERAYDDLGSRAHSHGKMSPIELSDLYESRKQKLEELRKAA